MLSLILVLLSSVFGSSRAPAPLSFALPWNAVNQGLAFHAQVTALAFSQVRPERMLAGLYADASLWVSDDGGETWHIDSLDLMRGPVHTVLVRSAQPGAALVGTGRGLFHSLDDGSHWQEVPLELVHPPGAVFALAEDGAGHLYLGGDFPDVLVSRDGGRSWTLAGSLPRETAVLALAIFQAGDGRRRSVTNRLLAGTAGHGMWLSRNGGQAWNEVKGIGETYVTSIVVASEVVDSGHGTTVLARTRAGLFRSQDGGETWLRVAEHVEGRIDALAVTSDAVLSLVTNQGWMYRSQDGGKTWQLWGQGLGRRNTIFWLGSQPRLPAFLFAATYSGLYHSDDDGQSWRFLADGPGWPSANSLALGSDGALFLGNTDGVFRWLETQERWQPRGTGLPPEPVLAVAVSPVDPSRVYAGLEGRGLYRSDDGGHTWMASGWVEQSVPALTLHPQDPGRLMFRVAYERIYASNDGGQTWTPRWDGLGLQTEIISLAINPHRPENVVAGATDALFRSVDEGLNWQRVGHPFDGQTVFAIAVDLLDPDRIYVGATKGFYHSDDNGRSWRPSARGLREVTVSAIAQHPIQTNLLYAGTKYAGIFRSADGGRTWHSIDSYLSAGSSVGSLLVSPDGRWLWAATTAGVLRAPAY